MTAYTWGLLEAWVGLPVLIALAVAHERRALPAPDPQAHADGGQER